MGKKKTRACFYLTHFFILTWSSLIQFFQAIFHPRYNSSISIKKVYKCFDSHSSTTIDSLSSHFQWFVNWRKLEATLLQFSGTRPFFFETQSSRIIATTFLSFLLCSSCSQVNASSPIMEIRTSLQTWYSLLNEKFFDFVKVFSISIGIEVEKAVLIYLTAIFSSCDFSFCTFVSLKTI